MLVRSRWILLIPQGCCMAGLLTSRRRHSSRFQPARSVGGGCFALRGESLEDRLVLDAAPYFVAAESWGTMSASATDFYPAPSRLLYDKTEPHQMSYAQTPQVIPGQPYNEEGALNFFLGPGSAAADASSYAALDGYFYHTDELDSIGQPDSAHLILNADLFASASATYDLQGNPIRVEGMSNASLDNTTIASFLIWDEDCPTIGRPIKGNWELNTRASAGPNVWADFPGAGSLGIDVTVRYWRAESVDQPLILDDTLTYFLPVGTHEFRDGQFDDRFELTIGSMIEVEFKSRASVISDGSATLSDLRFDVFVEPTHIDLHQFSHFENSPGDVDSRWMMVEYEVTEPICYFDLEFDAVAQDYSTQRFDRFRIDLETLTDSERFRVVNPTTKLTVSPEEALSIGTHWLLIDGDDANWRGAFSNFESELIVVHEPGQESYREEFHGVFHPVPNSPLVVRSDASSVDEVLLDEFTVEVKWNDKTSFLDFGDGDPRVSSATDVIVITAGEDDMVLAAHDFELPIRARLGEGDDVFLGGMAGDVAYGGNGDDILLGEGWQTNVTSLKTLLLDMLDLEFSMGAGLVPATGSDDRLYGGAGDELLLGGVGDDLLEAGDGRAIIFGDSLQLNSAIQVKLSELDFAANIDFTRSGAGHDTIVAGDNDTLVLAGGGDDLIEGNTAGSVSLLFGNGGNDVMTGYVDFAVIAGGAGNDEIIGSGLLIGDSFDFKTFRNSTFQDMTRGKLSIGVALTSTDSGDDKIQGGDGFDFIVGGDGSDQIVGGDGFNVAFGDGIEINLALAFDLNDLFSLATLKDVLFLPATLLRLFKIHFSFNGSGDDHYRGGSGTDAVFGGPGDDKLFGYGGVDFLVGGDGDDEVDAGSDAFHLGDFGFGGPGNDVLTGSSGPDYLESDEGDDIFYGLDGDDVIYGGADADQLFGGPGNDRLFGQGGDDQLFGGEGDDQLVGGSGDDTLDGGEGENVLIPDAMGDFNFDGQLDALDINSLSAALRASSVDRLYDVNEDGQVTKHDHAYWVQNLRLTHFGDANLDGEFNSSDLVTIFRRGLYGNATASALWEDGDWDGDGKFDSSDLIVAFQYGGYEQGPKRSRMAWR